MPREIEIGLAERAIAALAGRDQAGRATSVGTLPVLASKEPRGRVCQRNFNGILEFGIGLWLIGVACESVEWQPFGKVCGFREGP